jgi:hypothetical protein
MGTWIFIPGEEDRPVREVEHRHVVPTLRMSGAIPLFPPKKHHGVYKGKFTFNF